MTQAQDFPTTTSTISTDTFISDDGLKTNKATIQKIKNFYNFMIGSCVLINNTENMVVDSNSLRSVTYLRLDKLSFRIISREYPQLFQRFQQHNITSLQANFTKPTYLGYTSVFKPSFFNEEQHEHKLNIVNKNTVNISGKSNRGLLESNFDGVRANGGGATFGALFGADSQGETITLRSVPTDIELLESTSTIDGEETKPNSYSTNVYVVARVELL